MTMPLIHHTPIEAMHTSFEMFTAERARAILKDHQNVRSMNRKHVKFLAQQMSSGQWANNGETIKFGQDGGLVDGQHRLAAVVESGVTVGMLCVWGATSLGVDEGRRRAFGDLHIDGKNLGNARASIVRAILMMQRGIDPWGAGATAAVANRDLLAAYRSLDAGRFASAALCADRVKKMIPQSVTGVINYMASRNGSSDDVATFFVTMNAGAGLEEGSPMLALRRWLESTKDKIVGSYSSAWTRAKFVVSARAWNAHVDGRTFSGPALWTKLHDVDLPAVSAPLPKDGIARASL